MNAHCEPTDTIRFGPANTLDDARGQYTLDLVSFELRHQGRPIRIRPRAARALALLVRNEGRLVPCEQLRLELWGDRHLEWRNGLHRCVRDLRYALADDARHPRFVATVARLGYRFVGELTPPAEREEPLPAAPSRLACGGRRPSVAFVAGFAAALLLPVTLLLVCLAAAMGW